MSRVIPRSLRRRPLLSALAALCLALPLIAAPAAHARVRMADAAPPTPVSYHLVVLVTGGSTAGSSIEGAVNGMLDSTGVLTATVVTTSGVTATLGGTLASTGSKAATLTLQSATGKWSLRGKANSAGVLSGSVGTSSAPAGAWVLSPETVAHNYGLVLRVLSGPDSGMVLSGQLVTAATSATATSFDATYYGDDGSSTSAQGLLVNHSLTVMIAMKGMGTLIGVAPQKQETVLGTTYTTFTGTFIGPGNGDSGQWSGDLTS